MKISILQEDIPSQQKTCVENLEQTIRELTAKLAESESRFRQLFDNMTNGFAFHEMLYNSDGKPFDYRFIEVNPAFEKLTGTKRADVIGKTVMELFPDTEPYWIETYGKVASSGIPISFENYFKSLDRHYQIWAFCPQPDHFATIIEDITVRINTQKALLEKESQLSRAQRLESVGRLAGGVAHDYNNKLTVILGNAELAQMALPDTSKIADRLNLIIQAACDSRDITSKLLAFSRQQLITPRSVDLNLIIGNAKKSLATLAGNNIHIEFSPAESLWMVNMDPIQIDQIIMNLALNASDAMPDGGQLAISLENVRVDENITARNNDAVEGDYVLLTVRDNGTGMDENTLGHIFDPFFSTKDVGKGVGLGLSTIYGIVVQNRGFIDVSSVYGEGTAFRIYIPRHIPAEQK